MKIGLIVYGSNCDVDPMVSFSLKLAERGHQVEIFIISIHDRDYAPLNNHPNLCVTQKIYTASQRDNFGENLEYWSLPLDQHFDLMDKWYKAVVDEIVAYSYLFCARNEVIVGPQHILETACVAEKLGTPYVSLRTLPGHVRSAKIPPYWLSFFEMGDMPNDAQWDFLESHENKSLKRYINKFRRQHGMPRIGNVMQDVINSSWLNLISYSQYLHEVQDDWCPSFRLCGYFRPIDEFVDWTPNQQLLEFCETSSDAPVLISIYSMTEYENNVSALFDLLYKAAELSSQRVILHMNHECDSSAGNDNIFIINELVDFYSLIPLCRLVVHHGSIGLSHITCELGRPSITIKYGCDHPFNTTALEQVGVLNQSIYRRDLSAEKLAQAINDSIANPELLVNATGLSDKMKTENGLTKATQILEEEYEALKLDSNSLLNIAH